MPDLSKVRVTLAGCDDSTTLVVDLTEAEWSLLTRIGLLSEQASEDSCQPTLHVCAEGGTHD